jgi:S1-C subfamily serine protease
MISRKYLWITSTSVALLMVVAPGLRAQQSFTQVAREVNEKVVKLFGAGGFKGLPSYGSGVLVSAKGHILTCNNHILTTADLRVHLFDGRFYHAKVLYRAPELDVAICKIDDEVDRLPHFDFAKSAAQPLAEVGDWVLAFSNCFQIATRDEPMTVQRSVIATYAELRGRRGIFDAPYNGEVYFLDGILCNPGAAGGPITNRKGELLGLLGRELKSTNTDTWINYAVPIQARAEITDKEGKNSKLDMATFVKDAIAGTFKERETSKDKKDKGAYHGIILVPNAVSATPPYVEEVIPGSPGAQAGLRPDDLIVYLDGELVPSIRMFRDMMRQIAPGTDVLLEVQRANRLISVKLRVTEQPKEKTSK